MSPAEREARAQALLNQTIQRIAIEYGFTAKQKLVIQMPAENFGTMTSSMWLDPIAGWTPPVEEPYRPKEVNPVNHYDDDPGEYIGRADVEEAFQKFANGIEKGLNGDRG